MWNAIIASRVNRRLNLMYATKPMRCQAMLVSNPQKDVVVVMLLVVVVVGLQPKHQFWT